MTTAARLVAVLFTGALAAACSIVWAAQRPPDVPSDLYQLWAAARVMWHGQNPYEAIGPDRAYPWPFALFYPLPAAVLVSPLAWLPALVMDAAFVAISTAVVTWLITRDERISPLVWTLPSMAYLNAVERAQWSPLLLAVAGWPALSGLALLVKPNIASALWIAYPSRQAIVIAAVGTLMSVVIWPWWPAAWLTALQDPTGAHMAAPPVLLPGGPLLVAALWQWRLPEARLLIALACVPQTTHAYEAVPLFLIPRSHREGACLWGGALVAKLSWNFGRPYTDHAIGAAAMGQWMIWCLYLPCLIMVLRRRTFQLTYRRH